MEARLKRFGVEFHKFIVPGTNAAQIFLWDPEGCAPDRSSPGTKPQRLKPPCVPSQGPAGPPSRMPHSRERASRHVPQDARVLCVRARRVAGFLAHTLCGVSVHVLHLYLCQSGPAAVTRGY